MSRFMMNKFMRAVEMSDDAVARYIADPPAEVRRWQSESAGPHAATDDHLLTDEEADAFGARDFATLYRLGAHPYLIWHFVEAVMVHETTWPELNERYREAVRPYGYPDFIV